MLRPTYLTRCRQAFTLIELLIVVAIIAILAAIAVPNFLEAQTRSKVSRVRADQRSLATALESYQVDNNRYPVSARAANQRFVAPYDPNPDGSPAAAPSRTAIWSQITTPIAYFSSVVPDPFNVDQTQRVQDRVIVLWSKDTFGTVTGTNPYTDVTEPAGVTNFSRALSQFPQVTQNTNPNLDPNTSTFKTIDTWVLVSPGPDRVFDINVAFPGTMWPYDPTNGSISTGDVVRVRD